jgi:AraC family transcriptional regulator, regulatory protein of adaptative response / methylated-DNA-[protein]-cysteine methyltransferase
MATIRFGAVESSIGQMIVAESALGIAASSRSPLERVLAALRRRFPDDDLGAAAIDGRWIEEALSGGALPPIDLRGLTQFDARVYEIVHAIPAGQTMTYGDVGAAVSSPRAARAVGAAMRRCPLFPAVPCHRVVRASDGWSGWGGDVALKRRLLLSERR